MCYSASSSIGAFMISFVGSLYLFNRNKPGDKIISVILFGISTMQIAELLIHLDISCKKVINYKVINQDVFTEGLNFFDRKTTLNKIGSLLGIFSLVVIQPLFSLVATLMYGKTMSSSVVFGWLALFILNMVVTSISWPTEEKLCTKKRETCKDTQCKLFWPWFESSNVILYTLLVFILPLYFSKLKHKFIWMLYTIIGPVFLGLLYPIDHISMWCFFGPIITVLLKLYL